MPDRSAVVVSRRGGPSGAARSGVAPRRAALVLALAAALSASPAPARDGDRPGNFDFWVLALSWSPSWCEANRTAAASVQCARPFAFVVHGLWPQYARGFPANCPTDRRSPNDADVAAMLDVVPSPGLVRHEWATHGTCSGLDADAYFRAIRRAFAGIRIPEPFRDPTEPRVVPVAAIETAFRAANPGLDADEIAVDCDGPRLREVRICLTRDLSAFTPCPEVDRRACRAETVRVPAVRSGSAR